jgi:hypothetical protein
MLFLWSWREMPTWPFERPKRKPKINIDDGISSDADEFSGFDCASTFYLIYFIYTLSIQRPVGAA